MLKNKLQVINVLLFLLCLVTILIALHQYYLVMKTSEELMIVNDGLTTQKRELEDIIYRHVLVNVSLQKTLEECRTGICPEKNSHEVSGWKDMKRFSGTCYNMELTIWADFSNVESGSSSTAARRIINGVGPFDESLKDSDRMLIELGS